jgi:hypothetical protein
MPSFILRAIDPELWSRVQAKATAEGITVKTLILKAIAQYVALLVLAVFSAACAAGTPTSPTKPAVPTAVPAAIVVTAVSGIGASAGQVFVDATVQDATGKGIGDVVVQFTTTAGTYVADTITADGGGLAQAVVTTTVPATVTATTGTVAGHLDVVPTAAPVPPPPGTPPSPPPAPAQPTITLAPVATTVGLSTLLQANAFLNGVPAAGYGWSFGDGATFQGVSAATMHTYTSVGSFTTRVTVTDTLGRSAAGSAIVTVAAAPPPPPPPPPSYSVSLAASPSSLIVSETATLTASVTAQNGAPAPTSYAWDCAGTGIGIVPTASNVQPCTYLTAGTVASRVTVTGGTASGSGSASVTVLPGLVASLTCTVAAHMLPTDCNVTATYGGTIVPSGNITKVDWDWGDGTVVPSGGVALAHPYALIGTYPLVVQVTAMTIDGSRGPVTASLVLTIP